MRKKLWNRIKFDKNFWVKIGVVAAALIVLFWILRIMFGILANFVPFAVVVLLVYFAYRFFSKRNQDDSETSVVQAEAKRATREEKQVKQSAVRLQDSTSATTIDDSSVEPLQDNVLERMAERERLLLSNQQQEEAPKTSGKDDVLAQLEERRRRLQQNQNGNK
jgi:membrane protein implicated in regulation of membrane protease activity